jgi:hypothetical protein
MSIGPEERENIIRKVRNDAKDLLIQYYRQKFVSARNEYEDAFSRSDGEKVAKTFTEMIFNNNMLKMVEEYEIK